LLFLAKDKRLEEEEENPEESAAYGVLFSKARHNKVQ